MELVKELPEIFEEFAEQRQRSFLVMKEVKDKGIPVVGAYFALHPMKRSRSQKRICRRICARW